MTVGVASSQDYRDRAGAPGPLPKVSTPRRPGRLFGVRVSQLVGTQVAAAALLIGAVNGPIALAVAAVPAVLILALTWLRLRGRWFFEWIGVAIRFGSRKHAAPPGPAVGALLERVDH